MYYEKKRTIKIKTFTFLFFSFLILSYSCTEPKDLKSYAESLRGKYNIPGMAIAVLKADTILEMHALGYRKDSHRDTIQLDDRFHIGSNTKSMTSFAAASLIEKGMLEWSTKFLDLYPEWGELIDLQYHDITLEELLSHRAKIQAFWTDVEFDSIQISEGTKSDQRKEFNKYALNRDPITPDSLGFLYSNAGYTIASQMLEKVSDTTWEQLMIQVYNNDLDLDIEFGWPNRLDENQPWGHWTKNGKLSACPPDDDYNLDWLEPGGDVNISLPNYCKFLQLNLQGLVGDDNYLKSSTYDLLHTDRNGGLGGKYSFGWANEFIDGRKISWHAGSAGTFFTHALIDKTNFIAYVIMTNTNSPRVQKMIPELRGKMETMYRDFVYSKTNREVVLTQQQQDAFDALNTLQVNTDNYNRIYSTYANINQPCYPADTSFVISQSEFLIAMQGFVSKHCQKLTQERRDFLASTAVLAQEKYKVLHCNEDANTTKYENELPMIGTWVLPNVLGRRDVLIDWGYQQ